MPQDPEQPALSPAEWEVMKTLWDAGPLDARGVFAALGASADWAYPTVKTFLSRLVAKGAVDYDQVGNSYLYRAAVPREEMTRQEVRTLFDRVVGAAASPVLAHFIDEADLSDEDIRQLQRLLDEKRKRATADRKQTGDKRTSDKRPRKGNKS
jgi:BlaI family transcriptional regulator, penicillinase repressor